MGPDGAPGMQIRTEVKRDCFSVHLIRDVMVSPAKGQDARGILHSKPSPAQLPNLVPDEMGKELNLQVGTEPVTSKI